MDAQKIIDFDQFIERTHQQNDTLYVVNFWATWCKPCIAEIPAFEKLNSELKSSPVKIILLSLDFKSQSSNVEAFINKNGIQSETALLSAGNPNSWIDKIDESWSGAIPATVYYRNSEKLEFHEGDYSEETLKNSINKLTQ